ncbi:hypothetical protein F5Y12DRAFT_398425 [Xylaria sp. FL1777]|nr:hypothetical protein F5Y12DRAFT_398425 [Xylaria sp. FL1777]
MTTNSARLPPYRTDEENIAIFNEQIGSLVPELRSRIPPSQYPLPPSAAFDPIEKCRIKIMYFYVVHEKRINLRWRRKGHGYIPLIVIRLRGDYRPRRTDEARLAWKACFDLLRVRFGHQFCFTFQIGKTALQNWCFPRIIWLGGADVEGNQLEPYNPWDSVQLEKWIIEEYNHLDQGPWLGTRSKKNSKSFVNDTTTASHENFGYVRPDERVFHIPDDASISSDDKELIESIESEAGSSSDEKYLRGEWTISTTAKGTRDTASDTSHTIGNSNTPNTGMMSDGSSPSYYKESRANPVN